MSLSIVQHSCNDTNIGNYFMEKHIILEIGCIHLRRFLVENPDKNDHSKEKP